MGKPHKQESTLEQDMDDEDDSSGNHDVQGHLVTDDDFTDDWISHVDDFDPSDDVNDW